MSRSTFGIYSYIRFMLVTRTNSRLWEGSVPSISVNTSWIYTIDFCEQFLRHSIEVWI